MLAPLCFFPVFFLLCSRPVLFWSHRPTFPGPSAPPPALSAAVLFAFACLVVYVGVRWSADRAGRRALLHFRARLARFKFASRANVRRRLVNDEALGAAVCALAVESHATESAIWERVDGYLREIVPFFNVVAYYKIGYRLAKRVLNLFYTVTIAYEDQEALDRLPRDSIVVYLMNHRSNADYLLVSYALAGRVAISYAVGEWARAFPLEYLFKLFGSYFVRRRYRDPLYHAVLERYVQLITREGVTQGIFLEGGLTRNGGLLTPKIGLLDYVLGIARDPAYRFRIHLVPVAVNYDRVLEDRSLLRELACREGRARPSRIAQVTEVARYIVMNAARLVSGRWRRYGRAAVVVGAPMPLVDWFLNNRALFVMPRSERLGQVQLLADHAVTRIGAIVPVTPVPLACAAIQSVGGDFIARDDLVSRMGELCGGLSELNGRVVCDEGTIEDACDHACRLLQMRHVIAEQGSGYVVLAGGRELLSYYANSIAHLLQSFTVSSSFATPLSAVSGHR